MRMRFKRKWRTNFMQSLKMQSKGSVHQTHLEWSNLANASAYIFPLSLAPCVCARLSTFKRVLEVRGNESDRGISKCATWPLNGALLKRCSPLEQVEKAVQPACLKRHFILKLQSCGGLAEPVGNRAGGCKRKWVCSLEGHLSSGT